MKKIILSIDGMTCSACSSGLEKYLNKQAGIKNASVNLVMATANIEYDEKKMGIDKLNEFVKKAGFKSLGEFKEDKLDNDLNNEKFKLFIFSFLLIFIMYVSMGHMINLPIVSFLDVKINPVNYSIFLLLISILFLIYGFDIIKSGFINLIHKYPNMDTLVSIGVISSFIFSIYNLFFEKNYNSLYFESVCTVIFFVKLGRFIDRSSSNKVKDIIKDLVKITPDFAFVKKGNDTLKVTIDEVLKDDILVCRPGEKAPVDGEIISGKAHFDEAFITGESRAILKEKGDRVIAGSLNYDGYIEYRALKIGRDSTISEIVRLVAESSNSKAPIGKLADKVSSIFVPFVMFISLITFIFYLFTQNSIEISLIHFVSILVVSCPCSLGLATPLSIIVSEGALLKKGILIKKGEIIETIKNADTIIFDKTGTLTYGKPRISEIYNFSNISDKKLIQIAGSLEERSSHPISMAFESYMKENNIKSLDVKDFNNEAGFGITGDVDGKKVLIGNCSMLEKNNIDNKHLPMEKKLSSEGNTVFYIVVDDNVYALIGVCDTLRDEARDVINKLKNKDIECILLSGDNDEVCLRVANSLGIDNVISNVSPSEKSKIIKKLKNDGKFLVMCGDGINDSPALVLSDIGISISDASDIAINSADVILVNNNLEGILKLIDKSHQTLRIIKQNLFWAFFYNVLMIPVAMGFFEPFGVSLNPSLASFSMIFSSLFVVINSLRLRK